MALDHSLVTEDADFYKFTPFMFQAISPNGFVDTCWPNGDKPEALQLHASGFIAHKGFDPTVKWSKVTDTATGEIIGVAQWLIITDQKPPEFDFDGPPGTWENDTEKKYAQEIYRSFVRHRRELMRKEELPIVGKWRCRRTMWSRTARLTELHVVLSIMTVNPKHQYRGAGTLMMEWGTKLADELGALVSLLLCKPADLWGVF
jgi:hypothetical protein